MFDLFGWLRRKSEAAVLGGIADAVQKIEQGDAADLDRLKVLLAPADAKALPAAEEKHAKKGGR